MKIRVLGGGLYGCHIATDLLIAGHSVELHETADRLFSGASGNIPARLHSGTHYPRSDLTRQACISHRSEFMSVYGDFTRGVPVNIYAIAAEESLIDFGTYKRVIRDCGDFIEIDRPKEFGLDNVEGAVLTGERHILIDRMREHFAATLRDHVKFGMPAGLVEAPEFDLTIDCTFCAHEGFGIDRFEACITLLLDGPTDRAVTIMDGPLPSLYPWSEDQGLCSLTSAKITPMARRMTWKDAREYLDWVPKTQIDGAIGAMMEQMSRFYPPVLDYKVVDHRLAIRALPRSAADARLVEVLQFGPKLLRVRAGKLDAIFHAARVIRKIIEPAQPAYVHTHIPIAAD